MTVGCSVWEELRVWGYFVVRFEVVACILADLGSLGFG